MNRSGPSVVSTSDVESQPENFAPRVLGESIYDRVTSFLMAVVLGALMIVGLLGLIYLTNQAYASRVTAPLQIVEVSGGGGGSPEGTPGSTEKIDVPGADPAAFASNNEEEAGDFEEPSVQVAPGAMLDAVAEAGSGLAEVDLGPVMPSGGPVASGKRASKLGTGGPGLGLGPATAAWPASSDGASFTIPSRPPRNTPGSSMLWEWSLPSSRDLTSSFTSRISPARSPRSGTDRGGATVGSTSSGRGEVARRRTLPCSARPGIEVGEGVVLQFYPRGVEDQLAQLEVRYRGRQPGEIRVTRFSVVPRDNGYGFQVIAQETLR